MSLMRDERRYFFCMLFYIPDCTEPQYWQVSFYAWITILKNVAQIKHKISIENTGLFISPSGISELDCATTKKDRAERSISVGRESLKVFFCTWGLGVLAGSTARG